MTRPRVMTADRGYQPDTASRLYVERHWAGGYRLVWARPGETICVSAGGIQARTRREAVAFGLRHYNEHATWWNNNAAAPQPRK